MAELNKINGICILQSTHKQSHPSFHFHAQAQNADTHALKQHRLSENMFTVCSTFVLVIASDIHLEPESEKRAKNVNFYAAENIQIQATWVQNHLLSLNSPRWRSHVDRTLVSREQRSKLVRRCRHTCCCTLGQGEECLVVLISSPENLCHGHLLLSFCSCCCCRCWWWSPWPHLHVVGMLWFMSDINQPSLPTPFYFVFVSIYVFMTLSIIFHFINSPQNSPPSHSVLLVLFLPCWSF